MFIDKSFNCLCDEALNGDCKQSHTQSAARAVVLEILFIKSGRNLVLSEIGPVRFRYAEEIFSLEWALTHTLKGQTDNCSLGPAVRFSVGITRRSLDTCCVLL